MREVIPIVVFAAAAAWLTWRTLRTDQAEAAPEFASIEPVPDADIEQPQDLPFYAPMLGAWGAIVETVQPLDEDQAGRNLAAFLMTIRKAEGTAGPNGYRTMFGGRLFDSFADHPRIAHQFTDQAGRRLWTSAAGAYQFMAVSPIPTGGSTKVNTWDTLRARLGLPDFSPASQDAAAIELIREAGALPDVRAGRFADAVSKVRRIWASLPGAGYAQPEKTLESLAAAYLSAGGNIA
jgi:lysozyme